MAKPSPSSLPRDLRFGAPRRKALPIGERQRAIHVLFVFAAVIDRADRIGVRHLLRPHEIAAAQFETIEAELARRLVDQPLDGERHFRTAGAAIGLRRHGVGERGAGAQRRQRNIVGAGDQARALAQRRQRHAARADIAEIGGAHGEKAAVLVDRKRHLGDEIASLIVRQERFRALGAEFHRPAELARGPQHQSELDEGAVARAEIAADVE